MYLILIPSPTVRRLPKLGFLAFDFFLCNLESMARLVNLTILTDYRGEATGQGVLGPG